MLSRYTIKRGAATNTLPQGIRQDTRKHTQHVLRPTAELVVHVLQHADDPQAWEMLRREYLAVLNARFAVDRMGFDRLAEANHISFGFVGSSRRLGRYGWPRWPADGPAI